MLQPKRTKFRKMHKGRIRGEAKGGSDLNFGTFGLKATQPERVSVSSQTPRSLPNLSKFVWVKVRVPWIVGHVRSNLAVSCSKSTA